LTQMIAWKHQYPECSDNIRLQSGANMKHIIRIDVRRAVGRAMPAAFLVLGMLLNLHSSVVCQQMQVRTIPGPKVGGFAGMVVVSESSVIGLHGNVLLYRSDDAGVTWRRLPPFPRPSAGRFGEAQSILRDDSARVYLVFSDGGIIRSCNGGIVWDTIRDGGHDVLVHAGTAICIERSILFGAAIDGAEYIVRVSIPDGELHQTEIDAPVNGIAADSSGAILANAGSTVLYSENGGSDWRALQHPNTHVSSMAMAVDGSWLFATDDGLLRTRDKGSTVEVVPEPVRRRNSFIAARSPGRLYRQFFAGDSPGQSTDNGQTWTRMPIPPINIESSAALSDSVLLFSSEDVVLRSSYAGRSWTIHGYEAAPCTLLGFDTDGFLHGTVTYTPPWSDQTSIVFIRSSDGGITWQYTHRAWHQLPEKFPDGAFVRLPSAAYTYTPHLFRFDPGKQYWIHTGCPPVACLAANSDGVLFTAVDRIHSAGDLALSQLQPMDIRIRRLDPSGDHRIDRGMNCRWDTIPSERLHTVFRCIAVDVRENIYIGTSGEGVYLLEHGTAGWQSVYHSRGNVDRMLVDSSGAVFAVVTARSGPPRLTVIRSRDRGASWEQVLADNASGECFGFLDHGRNGLFLALPKRIMRSTDGGTNWTAITHDLDRYSMAVSDDGEICIAGDPRALGPGDEFPAPR
jgi:photosystem II stability/assembly factor-like uncharacterized protein